MAAAEAARPSNTKGSNDFCWQWLDEGICRGCSVKHTYPPSWSAAQRADHSKLVKRAQAQLEQAHSDDTKCTECNLLLPHCAAGVEDDAVCRCRHCEGCGRLLHEGEVTLCTSCEVVASEDSDGAAVAEDSEGSGSEDEDSVQCAAPGSRRPGARGGDDEDEDEAAGGGTPDNDDDDGGRKQAALHKRKRTEGDEDTPESSGEGDGSS